MLRNICVVLVTLLCVLALTGCVDTSSSLSTTLMPAGQLIEPIVNQYSDPETRLSACKTFSLLPPSAASGSQTASQFGNELLEKQMLFELRNYIEGRGYLFEPDRSKADIIATIDGSNAYQTSYIPPSTRTF